MHQVKNATQETPYAAIHINTLQDKITPTNLSETKVVIKVAEKISIFSPGDELISMIKKANTFLNPKYESKCGSNFNDEKNRGGNQISNRLSRVCYADNDTKIAIKNK